MFRKYLKDFSFKIMVFRNTHSARFSIPRLLLRKYLVLFEKWWIRGIFIAEMHLTVWLKMSNTNFMISHKRRVLPSNWSHGSSELNAFAKTAESKDTGSYDNNSENGSSDIIEKCPGIGRALGRRQLWRLGCWNNCPLWQFCFLH